MSPSIWQILIVVALALLLFGGRGRISAIMGDLARGITSFRQGLKEGEDDGEAENAEDRPAIESRSSEADAPMRPDPAPARAAEPEPVDVTPEPDDAPANEEPERDRSGG